MPTVSEQLASLALVDNLNRNSPEAPIASPWENASWPTEGGHLESGWGYYCRPVNSTAAARLTTPTVGSNWAASVELRQAVATGPNSSYFEVWLYLHPSQKTGWRVGAYPETTAATKFKLTLERWKEGSKITSAESTGVEIESGGSLKGGCVALVSLSGSVYAWSRKNTSGSYAQQLGPLAAGLGELSSYAGIGAATPTAENYYPAVMNFRMGELAPEGQLVPRPSTNNLMGVGR